MKEKAQEMAGILQQPLKESVEQIKSTAQQASESVEQAKASAEDVKQPLQQ